MLWVLGWMLIGIIVSYFQYRSEKKLFGEYHRSNAAHPFEFTFLFLGVALIWPITLVYLILIFLDP